MEWEGEEGRRLTVSMTADREMVDDESVERESCRLYVV